MTSITIDLQEHQLQKLQDLAQLHGISPEALLSSTLEGWLNLPKSDFAQAADYVLNKNSELYRRLA